MRRVSKLCGVALLLAGCVSETHHISFKVTPGDRAVVRVVGGRPRIQITNEGPGAIDLTFESLEDETTVTESLAVGLTERKLNGPVVVRVGTESEGGAEVTVSATSADGIALDQRPAK